MTALTPPRLSDASPLPAGEHPLLVMAFEHWDRLRGMRAMPARRELDPADMVPLLPHVVLTDVVSLDPPSFRYRLIGTAIQRRVAHDLTGRSLEDIPHQGPGSLIWELRSRCALTGRPVLPSDHVYLGPLPGIGGVREIQLPLSDDGMRVDTILTVVAFLDEPAIRV